MALALSRTLLRAMPRIPQALMTMGAVVALAALGRPVAAAEPATLRISGSSTVTPLIETAIQAYTRQQPQQRGRIQLLTNGSTAGLRSLCNGDQALVMASRPINRQELQRCSSRGIRFIELPIAFDAITVVVNPANTWARQISTQELQRLWSRQAQGRIQRWNQVNLDWPAQPIRLCGPGRDSGTYDSFNQTINGSSRNSRSDVRTSEDDAVLVRCVAGDRLALGYFGFSHYQAHRKQLKALAVLGPRGSVAPSLESVQQERYRPLSRPLFLYVNDTSLRRDTLLRDFLTFTVRRGLRLSEQAQMVPLPADTYRLVETKLYRHVLGSAFGGELPVDLSLKQALSRSLDRNKRPQFQ